MALLRNGHFLAAEVASRSLCAVVASKHAVAGVEIVRHTIGIPQVVLHAFESLCLPALETQDSLHILTW